MTLTEAVDVLWKHNRVLIRGQARTNEEYFFGAFTACARTTYPSAYGAEAGQAALTWTQAKTGDAYKEAQRLFDEINETEEPPA